MNYGLPYMGSKNKIAKDIIDCLPAGEVFVDLFCGGCAVTHAAMLSGKYKRFIINDTIAMMPNVFRDAIDGKFKDEKRIISREDFERLKDTDVYARLCWSFGNNGRNYLWGKEYAGIKMLACKMIMADDWHERLLVYRAFIQYLQKHIELTRKMLESLQRLQRLESLQRLQRLQRLQSLQRLQRLQSLESIQCLEVFTGDYQDVKIPGNAVVYCDPPYINTGGYGIDFDHERFYNWLRTRDFPVYVSEYAMPDDFVCIWRKEKTCTYSSANNKKKTVEKLFVHEKFKEAVKDELL